MKCFRRERVLSLMNRENRVDLESTVAELRHIAQQVQSIAPQISAEQRDDLREIQQQSEAAIQYYNRILTRPRPRRTNVPRLAQTVAQSAFGASGIGLVPPQFVMPAAVSKPRQ
jgi:hypothetical protein